MRKLRCLQFLGLTVHEALHEFNKRAVETGIASEEDIASVNVLPASVDVPVAEVPEGVKPRVEVAIVYWSDR